MSLSREEYRALSEYEIKLLKEDLNNYTKYIEIIPMFNKLLESMEVPGPKSALSEGSGVGIIGDSLSEDFAIKRADLADRVRIMKNTVERIELGLSKLSYDERELIQAKFIEKKSFERIADDLNRSKTGLIYIVNNICLKMIRK